MPLPQNHKSDHFCIREWTGLDGSVIRRRERSGELRASCRARGATLGPLSPTWPAQDLNGCTARSRNASLELLKATDWSERLDLGTPTATG
eukprot:6166969-Pleurochrysis_carterae.AAC.1